MVNTRTDADLSAAVQNALQTLLPQIRAEIREEFRTSSGPSDAGGNPSPVTIHTWLERFNKQKPHSFEKATAPVDAENWISHMEKIFDVMGYFKKLFFLHFFPRVELERLKREYHSIRQTNSRGVPYQFWTIGLWWKSPTVTIHTWLECFNKQKPCSFEKETTPVDAENWISHMEKIFDVMGCEDAFKTRLAVYKFEGNA
nr:hypothetical protein [Tanacetum cinerariifolium]